MTDAKGSLRRGWTTGACATAAAKAAYIALTSGIFPDPVDITLPHDKRVSFSLAHTYKDDDRATAGVIKDAGDDPDVTHGALVLATVRRGERGAGVVFRAGPGVGTVTKPGLPVPVGEPAINPAPRAMMRAEIAQAARECNDTDDVIIEISVPDGEEIAKKTMNPRLGILGGLSILGTTGVVIPYSCSAWIASIHEGIDVARATGIEHIAGSTGSTSEAAVARLYDLPESALIEMGDFAGGMLKYLRRKPVARVTIAGGFAKIAKLAQGHLDLHSARSSLDLGKLALLARECGAGDALALRIAQAHTGLEARELANSHGIALGDAVARRARVTALEVLMGTGIVLDVLVTNREGGAIGRADRTNG
jgi:cobalt-precorrin-5B (C1)-methyltransferase